MIGMFDLEVSSISCVEAKLWYAGGVGRVGGTVSSSSTSTLLVVISTGAVCVGGGIVSLVVSGAKSMVLTSCDGSLILLLGLKGTWFCSERNC